MLTRAVLIREGRAALLGVHEAARFLTRIPLGKAAPAPEAMAWAAAHFPAIGAILGLLGVGMYTLASPFSPVIRVLLVTGLLLLATGAFHEDGLADTADALGGAFTQERIFEILKDSRIGTFGAVSLFVVLALRVALLEQAMVISPWVLVAGQAFSRVPPVWMMRLMPYVTRDAAARSRQLMGITYAQVAVATLWALTLASLLISCSLAPQRLLFALLALMGTSAFLGLRFWIRLRGITGDFLGATQQLGEVAFYLGWALLPA